MRTRATNFLCVVAALTLGGVAASVGCSSTTDNISVGGSGGASSSSEKGGNGSASGGEGGGFNPGTGGSNDGGLDPDSACAAQSAAATLAKKPVDIIIVIDNSGSMSGEIEEVQEQINVNFANIIEQSGLDYRVIMLADFGDFDNDQAVCISAPLGKGTCTTIPATPTNNPPKFYHHDPVNDSDEVGISSHNALCQLIYQLTQADAYGLQPNGYKALLRPDSFKSFLVITDDRSSNGQKYGCVGDGFDDNNTIAGGQTAATAFDAALTAAAPEHFGTPANRNYMFHSIVALAPKDANNPMASHLPTDPVITAECSPGAENPGTGYQTLSVMTGGLRHHTCGLEYTTIFQAIAQSVIAGSKVACDFPVPPAPMGQTVDLNTVEVQYTPMGMGAPGNLTKVADAASCAPNSFYLDTVAKHVYLCPDVCTVVQADSAAKIDVLFACEIGMSN